MRVAARAEALGLGLARALSRAEPRARVGHELHSARAEARDVALRVDADEAAVGCHDIGAESREVGRAAAVEVRGARQVRGGAGRGVGEKDGG